MNIGDTKFQKIQKMRTDILSMDWEMKKRVLLELLREEGEWGEGIERNNIGEEDVNKIYDVLLTQKEEDRKEKLDRYIKEEIKEAEMHHKNLMNIINRIQKFDIKMKEIKQISVNEKDISDLEKQFLDM